MATLHLSTSVLNWAADQAGVRFVDLAEVLAPPTKRDLFLAGEMTAAQAEKFATSVRIPFGLLFLPEPPKWDKPSIPDLRQKQNPDPLSSDFFEVLEDVLRKVDWFSDYLREIGSDPLPFVNSFPFKEQPSVKSVARDIVRNLEIDKIDRRSCRTAAEFFSLLCEKAEAAGILVFKSGIVRSQARRGLSVSEFRGFAIIDTLAPTVFINGKDSESAWIFTLVHEIAHLWIGESGISDSSLDAEGNETNVERFCNRVAAEVLVPEAEFKQLWKHTADPQVDRLSSAFKVSKLVIARRAVDFRLIPWSYYKALAEERPRERESGGDPYRTIPVRNSKRFTNTVVRSAMYGKTLLRDAASLLNVKPDTIVKLANRGYGSV